MQYWSSYHSKVKKMGSGKVVMGIFLLMGLAVLTYLLIIGAFLTGGSKTAWEDAVKDPLGDLGIEVHNFGLFVAVMMIFGFGILLPIGIAVVRMLI